MAKDILFILTCLMIYISFVGWGSIITGAVLKKTKYDLGMASAAGMAFSALAGGVFNLLGIVSGFTVRAYVIIGLVYPVFWIIRNPATIRKWFAESASAIFSKKLTVFAGLLLAGLVVFEILLAGYHDFNSIDDFIAYLFFPVKMLEAGSLGFEPFSEGRMGIWGGHSFLQTLLLGFSDLHRIHGLDKGVAWLVFCSLIISHSVERRTHFLIGLILVAFCHLIPSQTVNASSSVAGLALFYSLMKFLNADMDKEPFLSNVVFVSLISAGLCSLKNSHISGCGMILLFCFLFGLKMSFGRRFQYLLAISCISAIFLSPWMLNLYQSCGTILYPILGKGHHGSAYGSFPSMSSGIYTFSWIFGALLFLIQHPFFLSGGILLVISAKPGYGGFKNLRLSLALFVATWLAAWAMLVLSGGVVRYAFPFTFACTVFLLVEFFSPVVGDIRTDRNIRIGTGILVGILLLAVVWPLGIRQYQAGWEKIQAAKTYWSDTEKNRLETAQNATPPGSVILLKVAKPFLMDFARNPIYNIDRPGGAGPPPGVQVFDTAEEIAGYFKNNGVQYILYSYGDKAGGPDSESCTASKSAVFARCREMARHRLAFQVRLLEIGNLYEKIYDDGFVFVADLNRPARHPSN